MTAESVSATSTRLLLRHIKGILLALEESCGRLPAFTLLFLYALTSVLEAAGLTLIVPVVQALRGDQRVSIPGTSLQIAPATALGLIIGVFVVRAALQWVTTVWGTDLRLRTTDALRIGALQATLQARWHFITSQRRSNLVQSLTTEVHRASIAIDLLFRGAVSALLLLMTALAALVLAPAVAAPAIFLVGALALLVRRDITRSIGLGIDLSRSIERFGAIVTDSLASIRLVRSHDAADCWLATLEHEAHQGRRATGAVMRRAARTQSLMSVAGVIGVVGLVLLADARGVDAAHLVALIVITARMLGAARGLVTQIQQFAYLAPALDHVQQLTTEASKARDTPSSSKFPMVRPAEPPRLELKHVSVSHDPGGIPALEDVNIVVPSAGLTVLSGVSGAGKSTLLDVVLGLLPPSHGEVLADGQRIDDLLAWRARTAYVPQEVVLVPGTVRHNLVWSALKGQTFKEADLWDALATAHLDDVVRALPAGLDTELRDLTQLSGGERQRLSIARALVRQPGLLVLDEATSALDSTLEAQVIDSLCTLGITLLLASHRASMETRADAVVHLAGGRVVSPTEPPASWDGARTRRTEQGPSSVPTKHSGC